MRLAGCLLSLITAVQAGVVARDWDAGKLTMRLDDGTAVMEWISPIAFRFARSWGGPIGALPPIAHEHIDPEFEESGSTITIRTKYLTAVLDRTDLKLQIKSGQTPVTSIALAKGELGLGMAPQEKVFGLLGGESGPLNVRAERLERRQGFFFTSAGYGIFVRTPERCVFNLPNGTVEMPQAGVIEYVFYYGPTPKEIMEQHWTVVRTAQEEVAPAPLPKAAMDSWPALRALVLKLNQWSLSGVLYPTLDLMSFDRASGDVKQRARDLTDLLANRDVWNPYFITYLREAHDRGLPLIRPLPMQFSRDANSDRQADLFMLGDEVLLAPVVGPGSRRRLDLPRGLWTDLRTNTEYRGNQTVEVDAPTGRVPMFVRNGWIIPQAMPDEMELHYFPSLGGEFFLWEPAQNDNSQFHAAPAGEYVRVEIETQVPRTYDWVIHHTKAAREVAEDATVYRRVERRALLRPGTWWHDDSDNNLHVMVRAEAGSDRIVNISF
jgi:hypothetical protein